jgi:hypothetical protein
VSASTDLARRQQPALAITQPSHFTGVVTRAPASRASNVGVVLPFADDDGTILHTISSWPSPGASLPAAGDACIVIFDDTREPSIVAWKRPGWGA